MIRFRVRLTFLIPMDKFPDIRQFIVRKIIYRYMYYSTEPRLLISSICFGLIKIFRVKTKEKQFVNFEAPL